MRVAPEPDANFRTVSPTFAAADRLSCEADAAVVRVAALDAEDCVRADFKSFPLPIIHKSLLYTLAVASIFGLCGAAWNWNERRGHSVLLRGVLTGIFVSFTLLPVFYINGSVVACGRHRTRYCWVFPMAVLTSVCASFIPVQGGHLAFVPVAAISITLGFTGCILLLNGPLYASKAHRLLDRNLGPPVAASLILFFAFLTSYVVITKAAKSNPLTGLLLPVGCQLVEFILYQLNKRCFLRFYYEPQAEFYSRRRGNLRAALISETPRYASSTSTPSSPAMRGAEVREDSSDRKDVYIAMQLVEETGVWLVGIDDVLERLRGTDGALAAKQAAFTEARSMLSRCSSLPAVLTLDADETNAPEAFTRGHRSFPDVDLSSGPIAKQDIDSRCATSENNKSGADADHPEEIPITFQGADDASSENDGRAEAAGSGQGIQHSSTRPSSSRTSAFVHELSVPTSEQDSEPPLRGDFSAVFANVLISTGLIIDNAKLVAVLAETVRTPGSRSWLVGIIVSTFLDVGKRSGGLQRLQMAMCASAELACSRGMGDVESLESKPEMRRRSNVYCWLGDLIALTSMKSLFYRAKMGCSYVCALQMIVFGCLRAVVLSDWRAIFWLDVHVELGVCLLTTVLAEILKDISLYAMDSRGLVRFPMCKGYAPEHPLGNTETRAMGNSGHCFIFMYGSFVVFSMLVSCMGTDFLFGLQQVPDELDIYCNFSLLTGSNDAGILWLPAYTSTAI